jgi:hypothetical protein
MAQRVTEVNGRHVQLFPDKDHGAKIHAARPNSNLVYHNGPTIHSAHVVSIFWGSSWTPTTSGSVANHIRNFFGQFGTSSEYNVITQYYDNGGNIQLNALSTDYWQDSNNPSSQNVSDAMVQAEVINAFNHGVPITPSTIYEVFIPNGYYASYGSSDSCGGPNLQFCAYHSNFNYNGTNIKYASMPYPSCSGCQWPGWSVAQNLDHFACHETREAVTDPDGNAWYDRRGAEADDKCAWTNLFLSGGYGYQPEWSNLAGGCVNTR